VNSALLVLWIALIGADRIDLAGGHGPFVLTPFLVLTPVVIVLEVIRLVMQRRAVRLTGRAMWYGALSVALLAVTLTSAVLALDVTTSAARAMLLVGDVAGTLSVAILIHDRPNFARILATGAIASLIVFTGVDVAEALAWLGRGPEVLRIGTMTLRLGDMQSLGPVPRLGGPVGDANRAAFLLIAYIFFIAKGESRAWLRRGAIALAMILFLLPFSRSATMAAIAAGGVALVSRRRAVSLGQAAAALVALSAIVVFFLLRPTAADKLGALVSSPVAQHLSTSEGSAQSHVTLIGRGIDEGMASFRRVAIGIGYGNGYLVLQDIFPGNRYGNFHSMYVTMFAESGILAFLLIVALMGTPFVLGGAWRSLVASALAFNVFYQTTTEPVFWFILAIAWLTIPAQAHAAPVVEQPQG
jgi:O-antigen ligase